MQVHGVIGILYYFTSLSKIYQESLTPNAIKQETEKDSGLRRAISPEIVEQIPPMTPTIIISNKKNLCHKGIVLKRKIKS